MEALGKLTGGVAHDFNNILTGITLAGELASQKAQAGGPAASYIKQIQELADRAAGLTRQLLMFSRLQALRPVTLSLNDLIRQTLNMLEPLIGEDIRLTFEEGADRDLIRADRGQVTQVLLNLAVNARDAMPAGGTLRIRTDSVSLEEGRHRVNLPAGPYVQLEISDSGHGMDEQTRRRVFEPFFTTKDVGQGTGLGLSTVYGIICEHQGAVLVDSDPGQGTTFRIFFPSVEGVAGESETKSEAVPSGAETILVAEDDTAVRNLIEQTLLSHGYRVCPAGSPVEAERIYKERRDEIALLLTDIVMPGESGPQLYRRLSAGNPTLRVLFMSGYTDKRTMYGDVLDPGLPFIAKPFRPGDLARKVREALEGSPQYSPTE
jgi:CheY-like chemotaxis protein